MIKPSQQLHSELVPEIAVLPEWRVTNPRTIGQIVDALHLEQIFEVKSWTDFQVRNPGPDCLGQKSWTSLSRSQILDQIV